MKIIPLSSIEVRARQRKRIEPGPLNELKESILGRGLLHPPVVFFDTRTDTAADVHLDATETVAVLSVGERRFRAVELIAKEGKSFHCNGQTIPPGMIPVLTLDEALTDVGKFEAELDENVLRVNLSWQEENQALADLHAMRLRQNPAQTYSATAEEIVAKTGNHSVGHVRQQISEATVIARHLDNPKIAKARNAEEAMSLILKHQEEQVMSVLVRRRLAATPADNDLEIKNGDALALLPTVADATVDLILADPPYGIGAESGGFRSRTVHHHNYSDTVQSAQALALAILTEGFRVTRPRANLFIFCDIGLFPWLCEAAANMGWTPFRTPVIWQKSESEGLAPWGSAGFRRTYEMIFYATKGQKGLNASPVDILEVKRVPRHERLFAAEKPVELLRQLISCATLPGDMVLDPCCGSGSTLVACRELKRKALGIEEDLDTYNTALANVFSPERAEA